MLFRYAMWALHARLFQVALFNAPQAAANQQCHHTHWNASGIQVQTTKWWGTVRAIILRRGTTPSRQDIGAHHPLPPSQ